MASGFPKLPGFVPTQPVESISNYGHKRVSAQKQEDNRDNKNKKPEVYPLPRYKMPEQPDQSTMFNPDYLSTTHDHYKPKNIPFDQVELYQPSYVKMDRHVLRFFGFFKESVVESNLESFRVRKLIIYYYLEDDSIELVEPKQMNSGIPQGSFLKRQKVLHENGSGKFLHVKDFLIGQDVVIFGKSIRLIDCDAYTREFFKNYGFEQPNALGSITDNWEVKTLTKFIPKADNMMKDFMEHKLGGGKVTSAKQFLENDRKVLKFYVFSDIPYILHYYLADDTVEIKEINFQNSGRDPFPMMLRRQKLPRKFALNQPGQTYAEQFLKPEDIKFNGVVDVFGRKFYVNGCDLYTQKYYKDKFGIEFPLGSTEQPKPKEYPQKQIPPYNGFGDEEDSLGYVYRLVPIPPKKDFFKWVDNQVILRFVAKFNTDKPEDVNRRFIISLYLNDDTLQIYEPNQRNSGIPDGKFLEKGKYKNAENNNEIYSPSDFIVGRDIVINGRSFHILDCDEYTRKWYSENFA